MAVEVIKAETASVNGLKVSCKSRGFEFTLDEPKQSGGTNEGMNPVEALLCSLGACKVIAARAFASVKGIELKSIRIEVEGELDPDGFRGINSEAKIGFSKLTSNFYIEADNTQEEISAFVAFINATCPVHDTIANAPVFETHIHCE